MAKKSSPAGLNLLSVVSFVTLLLILVSVFVLSGSFSDLVTTINQSKASRANPKVTESFVDPFKDGNIDPDRWRVSKSEGVVITETPADNLRFDVPAGAVNGKARSGNMTFKQVLKDDGDFRAMAVVYRPVVTGEGMGITGIRFSSKGADDDEAAVIRWQVSGTSSKAVFAVTGADGKRLETEKKDVAGNIAILRLDRINKKYRAFYKLGRDLTGDTAWIPLGSETDASLGNEGSVTVFTRNGGIADKFPKVVGRMDQFNIGWEGAPKTTVSFSDPFANEVINKNWKTYKTEGAQVYENANDNLIMSLTTGNRNNKPRYAQVVRTLPAVPEDKDFTLNAVVYKPTVVGDGNGFSGLGFVSTGNVDDEAVAVRWVVSAASVSRLVFIVRAPDGSLAERASVNIDAKVKRLTLRIARNGKKYTGHYRLGDSDTDFVQIGNSESSNFGAAGRVKLMVNNMGAGNKFPRVVGRFDHVSGSVSK